MKNNKGFVLIETIITTVVLATTLLYIYANYTNVLMKEKVRLNYDDIAYIYRTNYIKEYFKQFDLEEAKNLITADNPTTNIGCESEFVEADKKNECNNLMSFLHVSQISIASSNLANLKECDADNVNPMCLNIDFNHSNDAIEYLKSLGNTHASSPYILIVEYKERFEYASNLNSATCDSANERCMYNYSWINLE